MKNKIWTVLLLLAVLFLGGCGQKEEPSGGENAYQIYYLDSSATKFYTQEYSAESRETEALIQELMDQFLHVPKDLDCQPALPDKVGYLGSRQEDQVLYLYFDAGYTNPLFMDSIREILCRAALVKTMSQVEGISYISIYVADQPLLNADGSPVGLMADSDFIQSISDVNTFEKTALTLFFADETGQKLVKEEREVVHSINTSLERLVVEELIKGPQAAGCYATLPSGVKLLNVSVNESVCYLNFDSAFLTGVQGVNEYVPIYSIVNSLCEMTSITKVQITINGSSNVMFRDVVSLNTQFERKLEIGEETTE